MAETTFPKYRVKPGQSVNQNGVIHGEGAVLEIPRHVAVELRSILEPVDAEGEFPSAAAIKAGFSSAALRTHEKLQVLEVKKQELEKQLKFLDGQIADLKAQVESETEKRAKAKKPAEAKQPE